jgi:hypothetical protein
MRLFCLTHRSLLLLPLMLLCMHLCGFELLHQYYDHSHRAHTDPIRKIHSDVFKTPKFKVAVYSSDEAPILLTTSPKVVPLPIVTPLRVIVSSELPFDRPSESFPNKASPA